jgi:choline dehydrogenase-like flavoprotein
VLANRLTENSNWNVLLIEAGRVETQAQDVPVMAAYMQSTAYNWGYSAEPQHGSCLGRSIYMHIIIIMMKECYDKENRLTQYL